MNRYELMLLLDTKEAKKDWEGLEAHVHGLIKKHGGEVVKAARWDERKLVYEIQGQKRALYYLTYIQAPPAAIEPLRRDMTLDEKVMRFLFLRVEEFPEKIMTAQDYEDLRAEEDQIGGPPARSSSGGTATATVTKTEAKTEAKTETTEAKPAPETETKPAPETETKPAPEAEAKPAPETEGQPAPEAEGQPASEEGPSEKSE